MTQHAISMVPSYSSAFDTGSVIVVLISVLGLFGVARGCPRMMKTYFASITAVLFAQGGSALLRFFIELSRTQQTMERSWDHAYRTDMKLILDLQTELQCQGFSGADDRGVAMVVESELFFPPCDHLLRVRYESELVRLRFTVLCIRLGQLAGIFLLAVVFKRMAVMNLGHEGTEQESKTKQSLAEEMEDGVVQDPFPSEKSIGQARVWAKDGENKEKWEEKAGPAEVVCLG